jgi:hypothetical protein
MKIEQRLVGEVEVLAVNDRSARKTRSAGD